MKKLINEKLSTILKKISFIIILFISSQSIAQSQSTEQIHFNKNNVYLEGALGVLSQASINYERLIHSGEKVGWYGRIGAFSGYDIRDDDGSQGGLGAITMLIKKKKWNGEIKKWQSEFNAGAFVGNGRFGTFIYPLLSFGGRYQEPEGGFVFRFSAGTTVGISVGYAF